MDGSAVFHAYFDLHQELEAQTFKQQCDVDSIAIAAEGLLLLPDHIQQQLFLECSK